MARFLTVNVGPVKAVLAEWQQSGTSLTLTAFASAELAGTDDAGLLEASLTTALQGMMREKGIKAGPAVVSLGGQMVFPRFAKFAPVSGDALDEQVRFEVEQNVPFPIDEIVSDYQVTGDTIEGDKAALIVAAKHEQVTAVTNAVRAAGLAPKIVDVAPLAVTNAARKANPGMDGCNVILDIGAKTTNLILVEDEKIYNRSIPVGGNTILKDMAGKLQLSPDEAKAVLAEKGYVALGGVTEDEDQLADRVSKICRTVMTRLHAEISRSINFYRSQQGGSAPARLFLTGETSRLPQLDQFFLDSLQVATSYINPFDFVAFGGQVTQDDADAELFSLAEAAGCALRMLPAGEASLAINLLPPELVQQARNAKRVPYVAFGCLCVLGALVLGQMTENAKKSIAEERKQVAEEQANECNTNDELLKKAQKEEAAALAKADDFQKLLSSRSLMLRRVAAVRNSLKRGMWITDWREKSPDVVLITVRGWDDAMKRAEENWSDTNPSSTATVEEIVVEGLKNQDEVDSEAAAPNELKTVKSDFIGKNNAVREFSLQIPFKPLAAMVEAPKKPAKGGAR